MNSYEEILCSAKTNENINKLFERVAEKVYENNGGEKMGFNNLLSRIHGPDKCCSN